MIRYTVAFLFLVVRLSAQQQTSDFKSFNPRFEVFKLPGSMLGNSVQGIVQDKAGFLWFASQEGLHRYDGQTFFTYHYDPINANSLASDYIEYIFHDSKGVLWLAHYNGGGLTAFDPATETFTRYNHDPNNPETLSSNTNSIIAEDRQGYIWIGGAGGIDRFDRETGKFKRFQHDPNNPRSLSYNQVRGLYVDKKGAVWVGTGFTWDSNDPLKKFGGLNRYDPHTESFTRFLHDPKDPTTLANNHVRSMLEDSKGNFWVGTGGDGLHLMNRGKGTFTRLTYDPKNPDKLSAPRILELADQSSDIHVSSIFEDRDGRIWITAVYGGLNVYDPASGKMRHFERETDEGSLTTNFGWFTFQSTDGVIWIATGNGGGTVFKVKKEAKRFPHFAPTSFVGGSVVSDVVKDKAGNVWIGYFNNHSFPLMRYDRKSGKWFSYPGDDKDGLNANQVNALWADPAGYVWVGTEKGMFRLDPQTGKFRSFQNQMNKDEWVANLYQDRSGIVWAYNWEEGLRALDPKTGKYTSYQPDPANPGSIGGTNISGLFQDAKGNIWVSGGSGNDINYPFFIDRFNPGDKRAAFTHLIKEPEANTAFNLLQDDQGNFWFISNGSIEKFNPTNGARQKFTAANSNLLERNLTNMDIAKNGRIWINSNGGFVYELDPKTAHFQAFGKPYLVPSLTDEVSEVHVAYDGEVLIGRAGGFIAFYPDSLHREGNNRQPEVGITDFRLLEERIIPGGSSILKKPIWQTTELRLANDQNVFSFSVSCFDFADPASNQLQFMLEGYDKGWRKDLRDGETPSYINVPSGTYTFRVRGSNGFGTWNKKGASLQITVSPPWWKTGWAYALYGLFLIVGLFFTNRILRKNIEARERAKSKDRELAQAKEIEIAYTELKTTQTQLESRNRDLEIEAALERVRGQAMSMGTSDELSGLVATVFHELTELDFRLDHCIIWIFDADTLSARVWTAGVGMDKTPESYFIKNLDHTYYRAIIEGWRAKDTKWVYTLGGEEKKSIDHLLFNETEFSRLPEPVEAGIQEANRVYVAISFNNFGGLEASGDEPISEENLDILSRFGKVFDLTYTRFLDLKNSEEHAMTLAKEKVRLENTLSELRSTQSQLIQSEKLASLGELTAGIAHEIQNPLNFVNNFSELSVDLAEELKQEIEKLEIPEKDKAYVGEILGDLSSNQQKINLHGKRASSIVTGMLQHARTSTGKKEPTDINALADEYLRLSYHGLRAKDSTFNAKMTGDFDPAVGKVDVIPQDIGRVLLNLINNAFYAVSQRSLRDSIQDDSLQDDNPLRDDKYEPTVIVSTKKLGDKVEIRVQDNGTGIPDSVKAKIFQPFFTTKPTGQGTGLGLSLAYDIVTKGHGGELTVETKEGEGTTFVINLPIA